MISILPYLMEMSREQIAYQYITEQSYFNMIYNVIECNIINNFFCCFSICHLTFKLMLSKRFRTKRWWSCLLQDTLRFMDGQLGIRLCSWLLCCFFIVVLFYLIFLITICSLSYFTLKCLISCCNFLLHFSMLLTYHNNP